MEKSILKHGIDGNRYFRIIDCITEYITEGKPCIEREYVVKLQLKIYTLGFVRYVTIKSWTCDYYDTREKEFIKSEAEELFDNIVNPYKI